MYEEGDVTSVEEGHDVEHVTAVGSDFKDTKSTLVQPAMEIYDSRDVGQPDFGLPVGKALQEKAGQRSRRRER